MDHLSAVWPYMSGISMASFLTYYEKLLVSLQSLLLGRLTRGQHDSLFAAVFSLKQDPLKSQVGLLSGPNNLSSEDLPKLRFEVSAQLGHSA